MDCPKCGHKQDDTVKCESCGIYFAKLRPPSPPTRPKTADRPRTTQTPPGLGAGALAVTALVTAAAVFTFMRGRQPTPAGPATAPIAAVPAAAPIVSAQPAPALQYPQPQSAVSPGARNPIEAARNAAVFIKTGWGLGSGFIIDSDCHVITNRHVVETDGARVANNVEQDPDVQERLAVAQQQLVDAINREQQLRQALTGRPGTSLEQVELDRHIALMQQQLVDLSKHLRQVISQKVEGSGRSGFSATLVDGREFDSLHAEFATNFDLALFKLPTDHCPHIVAGHSKGLAFGQRLYTIGNPSGLAYTVTSGIFSGERGEGHERLLQTDAPINPGSSGGPLITEDGEVVGINTLVLRGTQGIGFAIPIEAAFDDFSELRGARYQPAK
jgi:serine protease Do